MNIKKSPYGRTQNGSLIYAADAGSNDTYVISLDPAPGAYTTGMVIHFYANTINTGAATLNVNGLGAKTILKNKGATLANGDIAAGQIVTVVYDGTYFQMQSQCATAVETGDAASATTTATGTATDSFVTPAGLFAVFGYVEKYIPASAMTPTTTNGAAFTETELATNDIMKSYFLFDTTTEEYVAVDYSFPDNWDRGAVKFKFYWGPNDDTGTTSNTVEWEVGGIACGDDDALDTAVSGTQVISDTILTGESADLHISGPTPAITIAGTPALGDLVSFKISRNVGGTDNYGADARLYGAKIQYKVANQTAVWA